MNRLATILSVALVVQIGLAILLTYQQRSYRGADPSEALFSIDMNKVDRIVLEDENKSKVDLVKGENRLDWKISNYHDFPAHGYNMQQILDKLKNTKRGWTVATTEGARDRFKVEKDSYNKKLSLYEGSKNLATLYLGKLSGLKKTNVRLDGENNIYEVEFGKFEISTEPKDWMNKQFADWKPSHVKEAKWNGYTLAKSKDDWKFTHDGKTDSLSDEAAQEVMERLCKISITEVLGTTDKPEYNSAHPEVQYTLTRSDDNKRTYSLSKPAQGDFLVLHLSDGKYYLKTDSWYVSRTRKMTAEWLLDEDKAFRAEKKAKEEEAAALAKEKESKKSPAK